MTTITALATPPGIGGLGVIRISGPEAARILQRLFRTSRGKPLPHLEPWRQYLGFISDPESGEHLDQVIVSFMAAPRSYTGDDTAEISHHGGAAVSVAVIELIVRHGARLAEPGEFTRRAFLNGRIDLAQAEAIADLINARSQWARRAAMRQLEGGLSQVVNEVKQKLVEVRTLLEAAIDFSEEDLPLPERSEMAALLEQASARIGRLIAVSREAQGLRNGLRAVILGRPNAGKSSVMNRLLRYDRVIVDHAPGTTRDAVEVSCEVAGVTIQLVDTAGLRRSRNRVEQEGMRRAQELAVSADMILFVIDATRTLTKLERDELEKGRGRDLIVVLNKQDLPGIRDYGAELAWAPCVRTSCTSGEGMPALREAMAEAIRRSREAAFDEPAAAGVRHREALETALQDCRRTTAGLLAGNPPELAAADLQAALMALGQITGETTPQEILNRIFSQFCIGK